MVSSMSEINREIFRIIDDKIFWYRNRWDRFRLLKDMLKFVYLSFLAGIFYITLSFFKGRLLENSFELIVALFMIVFICYMVIVNLYYSKGFIFLSVLFLFLGMITLDNSLITQGHGFFIIGSLMSLRHFLEDKIKEYYDGRQKNSMC